MSGKHLPYPSKPFNFLQKIHDDFQPLSLKIKFDKKHSLHITLISYYGSIFELTGSCISLIQNELFISIPIVLRSILEAQVDLVNLINDPEYGYTLRFSFLNESLKLFDEAQNGNDLLEDIATTPNFDENHLNFKREKDLLKSKGYKLLTNEQKFKKAGMMTEYNSIYNRLCCDSHNNLSALGKRHLRSEEDDISVVFYKTPKTVDIIFYIAIITEIFIKSAELIHDFFNTEAKDIINIYRNEFDTLTQLYNNL